jgi:biotin carboxyl carrier protein
MKYLADADGKAFIVAVDHPGEVVVDGERHTVSLEAVNLGTTFSIIIDGRSYEAFVERRDGAYTVEIGSERHQIVVEDERLGTLKRLGGAQQAHSGEVSLKAPMPGLVVAVRVEVGQPVEPGQGVVILEAMKMENELRASRGGVVKAIRVRPGQAVNQGETLIVIE